MSQVESASRELSQSAGEPRPVRDIVVVGASAGGLPALIALVGSLPAAYAGTLFVTLHLPAGARSALASILTREGELPAVLASEGAPIRPGHIYVAPPDTRHLIVGRDRMHLVYGPRENGVRPAVDPLFRSAARSYGRRVIGIILSGTGADGTEGIRAIKAAGGLAIAQDPTEAEFAGMPGYAIRFDDVDYVLPAAAMGPVLDELARSPVRGPVTGGSGDDPPTDRASAEKLEHNLAESAAPQVDGVASGFTCPDCGGPLWEARNGDERRFVCRVGHRWTGLASLVTQRALTLEMRAWELLNGLEEYRMLLQQLTIEDYRSDPALPAEAVNRAQQAQALGVTIRAALPELV
jgi:two-component system chemotaxis response regulator CheB